MRPVLLTSVVGIFLISLPPLSDLSYDLSYLLRPPVEVTNLVIVAVNENTLHEAGDGRNHLYRSNHVNLLNRLADDGPRLVFYDFAFNQAQDPDVDSALGKALARLTNAVVVTGLVQATRAGLSEPAKLIDPVRQSSAARGHVQLARGNINREIPEARGQLSYAPWLAAARLNPSLLPEEQNFTRWFNFYDRHGNTFLKTPFHDALKTNVPAGYYHDRLVFVGQWLESAAVADLSENFATPYNLFGLGDTAGVVIHATAFLNLLRNEWLRTPSRLTQYGLTVAWAVMITAVLYQVSRRSLLTSVAVAAGGAALLILGSLYVQWQSLWWWAWAGPALGQTITALVWTRFHPKRGRYTAFISYRNEEDGSTALLIARALADHDCPVFIDVKKLEVGRFDEQLLRVVEEAPYFIIILSPASLRRCVEKEDWVLRELSHALATNRRIIPVLRGGFSFKAADVPDLPEIHKLSTYHGLEYSNRDFDGFIRRLLDLLKKP